MNDPEPTPGALIPAVIRVALAAAILSGFIARAATFQVPLFDFHAWRQADTATIARNFYRGSLDPTNPQIDARGAAADGGVETGLELTALLVALIARGVGYADHLGRLVGAVTFPFAALLLYRFARERYGEPAALGTAWLYSVGFALSVFIDRAFMNEALLALLSIVCLRAAQQYLAGRAFALIALVAASTVLGLVKPPYLVVWAAIGGLFIERHGWRGLVRWEIVVAVLVNTLAVWMWFSHAHQVFERTGLTFGTTDKLFRADIAFSFDYWSLITSRLMRDVLGPFGFALSIYGLIRSVGRRRLAEACGLVGFMVYVVIVTIGNANHNYYQLQVVPIAAVLAGLGIMDVSARVGAARGWTSASRLYLGATLVMLCVLSAVVRSASFHSWYEPGEGRQEACEALRPMLRPDDLVAFIGYASPDMLYCVDRRGWLYGPPDTTPEFVRTAIRDGAAVIVVPREFVSDAKVDGATIVETLHFVAYRVK